MWNVVDDAVAGAGDVPPARLEDVHVFFHVAIDVLDSALDERELDVDVAAQGSISIICPFPLMISVPGARVPRPHTRPHS